jgi:uncharacterized membrane protein YphA (DoxX/SURF4 family)
MSGGAIRWAVTIALVAARAVLAVVFVLACVHKILDPYDFAMQVATYQILPLGLVNLQAIALPWVELATGILLILGLWTRPAALLTCGMNLMFIVAIAMALAADLQLQCGCFSSADAGHDMSPSLIVRDAALLLAGAFLVAMRPDRFTLDAWLGRRKAHA